MEPPILATLYETNACLHAEMLFAWQSRSGQEATQLSAKTCQVRIMARILHKYFRDASP
jgi:hypothetical protein